MLPPLDIALSEDSTTHQQGDKTAILSNVGQLSILQQPQTSTLICLFIILQRQEMEAPAQQ